MPYCVRCGVELHKEMKACPLCQTEVLLPEDEDCEAGIMIFPEHMPKRRRKAINMVPSRSFLVLSSFIFIIPILVTLIIDFTSNKNITWSFYPMTSLALLWVLISYPAFLKKPSLLQIITVDIVAVCMFLLSLDFYCAPFPEWSQYPILSLMLLWFYLAAPMIIKWRYPLLVIAMWFVGTFLFLYSIDKLTGEVDWFLPLGLPIIALLAFMGSLFIVFLKIYIKKPLLLACMSILDLTLSLIALDGVVNQYVSKIFELTWSPILASVLIPTSVFLIIVNGNTELKAYLSKKFHL